MEAQLNALLQIVRLLEQILARLDSPLSIDFEDE